MSTGRLAKAACAYGGTVVAANLWFQFVDGGAALRDYRLDCRNPALSSDAAYEIARARMSHVENIGRAIFWPVYLPAYAAQCAVARLAAAVHNGPVTEVCHDD